MHAQTPSRAGLLAVLAGVLAASAALAAAAGAAHPQVSVGGFPTGIALNPSTHTIYVGNGTSAEMSLIDGRTCNAGKVLAYRLARP